MLQAKELSYHYNDNTKLNFPDLIIEKGANHLILGPSGCGKTTLLHLLSGLLKPNKGSVTINETNLNALSSGQLDKFRGEKIGMIFQKAHFVRSLNVIDNLLLGQFYSGNKLDKQKVISLLERLNLGHKIKSPSTELSEGEKQRVAIARAMVNDPLIIFADEPTSALDDGNCNEVIQLLKEQSEANNASLVIVTHDNRLKDKFHNRLEL